MPSTASVEQMRGAFAGAGFDVEQALNWNWTSPPVSTFRVFDPARSRVVMVLVYPTASAADAGRKQAEANEQALSLGSSPLVGLGPHLVPGYGESFWRGNVALVATTRSELDRVYRWQNTHESGFDLDPDVTRYQPSVSHLAVDFEFRRALETGAANL
jgi:hypothetical protein